MKANELAELNDAELVTQLRTFKEELFNLRFQNATGQLDNVARIPQVRRDIARCETILRAREIEAAEALIALARHPAAVGQAFIYSESAPLSVFLSWMGRELGRKTWAVPVPGPAFDLAARATQFGRVLANQRRFSAEKIESMLGFCPSVGLREGLARTLRHYREAGLIKASGQA